MRCMSPATVAVSTYCLLSCDQTAVVAWRARGEVPKRAVRLWPWRCGIGCEDRRQNQKHG
jgi:hypothetical protein